MNTFLLVLGILAVIIGLGWAGQGLGYIRWPSFSTMISKAKWAYYGGALAIVGLILILISLY